MEFTKDINFNIVPTANENLTITYHGNLCNSTELSIVYGYGDSWENTTEQLMEKQDYGFSTTVNILDYDTFNFCFKNSNNEWDNNSYCNYIIGIAPATNTTPNFDIDTLIEELLLEPVFDSEKITKEDFDFSEESEENLDLGYQISSIISNIEDTYQEQTEYNTLEEILTATKINNSTNFEVPGLETIDDIVTSSNLVSDESSVEKTVTINNNVNYYDDVFEEFLNNSSFITPNTSEENNNTVTTTNYYDNSNNEIFDEFIKNLSAITSNTEEKNDTMTTTINQTNKIVLEPLEDDDSFQTIISSSSKNEETALIETSDNFLVSSRKLGTFYLFKKRMKLILYKVFVKIPKLLLGLDEKE